MSKVLFGTAEAGVVKVGEFEVPEAVIIGKGMAPSDGVVIVEQERVVYIPKTVSDLENTLDGVVASLNKTVEAIQKIATVFTSIGAGMTGATTAPPPTLPADVIALGSMATELTVFATELENLKENLK